MCVILHINKHKKINITNCKITNFIPAQRNAHTSPQKKPKFVPLLNNYAQKRLVENFGTKKS